MGPFVGGGFRYGRSPAFLSGNFKSPYLREKGTFRKVHTGKYL
jgi:hypothetical protein